MNDWIIGVMKMNDWIIVVILGIVSSLLATLLVYVFLHIKNKKYSVVIKARQWALKNIEYTTFETAENPNVVDFGVGSIITVLAPKEMITLTLSQDYQRKHPDKETFIIPFIQKADLNNLKKEIEYGQHDEKLVEVYKKNKKEYRKNKIKKLQSIIKKCLSKFKLWSGKKELKN